MRLLSLLLAGACAAGVFTPAEDLAYSEALAAVPAARTGWVAVAVVDGAGRPVHGARVEFKQVSSPFRFGCDLYRYQWFSTPEENAEYARRFEALFDCATVPFYWSSFEPEPGAERWAQVDGLLEFCSSRGILVRGQPLVWLCDDFYPGYARRPFREARGLMLARVRRVVSRAKGRVRIWDVVNEAAACRGVRDEFALSEAETVDFVAECFRAAREADPEALLLYNEGGIMGDVDGAAPPYRFIEKLLARGAPVDAIGIQAHFADRLPLDRVARTLDAYARLGKPIHLTELMLPSLGDWGARYGEPGEWTESLQAEFAARLYAVAFCRPFVKAVTWGELCDRYSTRKGAGMLRADLSPKPVYYSLRQLKEEWRMESASPVTDAQGRCEIGAFAGGYRVEVSWGGRRFADGVSVEPGRMAAVRITVR